MLSRSLYNSQPIFMLLSLPDDVQEIATKGFQFMLRSTKLSMEIKDKEKLIGKLPPSRAYDEKGEFIPRDKREGVFVMAEHLKEYYEKVDELKELFEVDRRERLVSEHKRAHPPNTEECSM